MRTGKYWSMIFQVSSIDLIILDRQSRSADRTRRGAEERSVEKIQR